MQTEKLNSLLAVIAIVTSFYALFQVQNIHGFS